MAIKLLVADLDGTIVRMDGISERSFAAIRAAQQMGVKVTFATGRMHGSAVAFARAAGIELPIITCNGAVLKSCDGEVVYEKHMDPALVKAVIETCIERGWHVQWYIKDQLYVYEIKKDMWIGYDEAEKIEVHEAKGNLDRFSREVIQLVVLNREGEVGTIGEVLERKFAGRLFAPQTAAFCIDIVEPGVHKAIGIEFLAKQYGIDRSEIMAIGDSDNDTDMIRYAGLGVAMGNAFPSLKEVADVIAPSCMEDGFAAAVEEYILKEKSR